MIIIKKIVFFIIKFIIKKKIKYFKLKFNTYNITDNDHEL